MDLASESELATIEADARAAVDASITFARESNHPDPEAGVLHTYANSAAVATQFYNRSGLSSTT
jgi:TPP-dependent pyruvate/acetoin dehydrogenase alpha subunit